MELKGVLLSQPWGMYGVQALAGRLYASAQAKQYLDSAIPFGEYIIGGDKFYETYVVTKDEYINSFFKRLGAHELGETAYCEFGSTIPFTVKVLSLRVPAPLLCYPSEEKGNLFHSRNARDFPYTGTRHGMVVALTDFLILIGFRSLDFIIQVFENVPEFRIIIDEKLIDKFLVTKDKNDFLNVFKELLDNLPSQIEYAGKLLKTKLINSAPSCSGFFHPMELFEKLVDADPCDVGIFLPYFLNVVKLRRLEALIIPAETPYAYLYGEALECSNSVQNAAAAAFSSRRDLDRFCDSLDLRFWTAEDIVNSSVELRSVDNYVDEYLTPSPFYRVFIGTIREQTEQTLTRLFSFSVLLIIKGEGKINGCLDVVPGAAFLFFKKQKITFSALEKIFFVQVSINLLV